MSARATTRAATTVAIASLSRGMAKVQRSRLLGVADGI